VLPQHFADVSVAPRQHGGVAVVPRSRFGDAGERGGRVMRVRIGSSPGSELLVLRLQGDGSISGDCQVLSHTGFSGP
jgi:hypothetical protein